MGALILAWSAIMALVFDDELPRARLADELRAADLAVKNPYWNPRPVTRDAVRALLGRACAGVGPGMRRRA